MELGLGISESDRRVLVDNVSIVYHVAASVRFDDPLKKAILMNTRSTREMMMLTLDMKKLKVVVHVSTTFCNCDKEVVEEIVYPPHADWKQMINMAETLDDHMINVFTAQILDKLPNTYTFTKSLAEHVVKDLGENLPTVIFRPSVVVNTLLEPFPGWIDNFNGPIGLMIAGGKGILRMSYADPNVRVDYMPVDVAIQFMIIGSWCKANLGSNSDVTVYNSSSYNLKTLTNGDMIQTGLDCAKEVPLNGILWCPDGSCTKYELWYYMGVIFLHFIPGLIIDSILKLSGRKPILVSIHRRVYAANMALSFFVKRSWAFKNENCLSLRRKIPAVDKEHFPKLDELENADQNTFFLHATMGGRNFLLKEPVNTLPQAKIHYRRMYVLDKAVRMLAVAFCSWCVLQSAWLHSAVTGYFAPVFFS